MAGQGPDEDSGIHWAGPYLVKEDLIDPWSKEYQYSAPGQIDQYGFDLWSKGPDQIDGNEDDLVNWQKE